jgi:hypothetical protein
MFRSEMLVPLAFLNYPVTRSPVVIIHHIILDGAPRGILVPVNLLSHLALPIGNDEP